MFAAYVGICPVKSLTAQAPHFHHLSPNNIHTPLGSKTINSHHQSPPSVLQDSTHTKTSLPLQAAGVNNQDKGDE
jgi:hypothetical protein